MKNVPKTGAVQVDFTIPGRTVYNLSKVASLDMKPGALYPVRYVRCVTRDRHELNLRAQIMTFPTEAPVMNPFKVRFYAFFVPDRLYVPELRTNDPSFNGSNASLSETIASVKYPVMPYPGDAAALTIFDDESFNRFHYNPYGGPAYDDFVAAIVDFVDGNSNVSSSTPVTSILESAAVVQKGSLLEFIGIQQGTAGQAYYSAINTMSYVVASEDDSYGPFEDFGKANAFAGASPYLNATRVLAYYDIFRNYFANPNEEYYPCYVKRTDSLPAYDDSTRPLYFEASGDTPSLMLLPFNDLNEAFNSQSWITPGTDYPRKITDAAANYSLPWTTDYWAGGLTSCQNAGLVTKCYLPDINSTFIGSGLYQKVIAESIVSVSNGQLNMQDLLVGQRIHNYFQKIAATGGRFHEWIRAEYGVNIMRYLDIPVFLRTWTTEVAFSAIYSTNAFMEDDSTGLGQMAGRGTGSLTYDKDSRRRNMLAFTPDEPGDLVILASIEPIVSYKGGIDWYLSVNQFDDLYTPSMDRIGMQPVHLAQIDVQNSTTLQTVKAYIDGNGDSIAPINPYQKVIGYQPAWTEYKSEVNRVYGDMADNLSYWSLIRDPQTSLPLFDNIGQTPSTTSYIIPSMYNTPFQDTTEEGNPFIVQIAFDHIVKRAMSARSMTGFAEGAL